MKKKPTEDAALKSLRKIEENTSGIVGKLDKIVDRVDRTSRLSTILTCIMMLIVMWMAVFTVSITLRESWLGIVYLIVSVGIGISVILAFRVLKKPHKKLLKKQKS